MLGLSRSQVTIPIGFSGSLAIANPQVVAGAIGSQPVNISALGSRDWYAYVIQTSFGDWGTPQATGNHAKLNCGFIRRRFACYGPTGTTTASNQTNSVFAITSALGDDDCLGQTRTANFLSANSGYVIQTANNTLAFNNWGFRLAFLAGRLTRTGRIMLAFSSGGAAANNQLQITGHLTDGSAPDKTVTISPGAIGVKFYTVDFTFKASSEGVELVVFTNVIQNTQDSGTQIGFIAAYQN